MSNMAGRHEPHSPHAETPLSPEGAAAHAETHTAEATTPDPRLLGQAARKGLEPHEGPTSEYYGMSTDQLREWLERHNPAARAVLEALATQMRGLQEENNRLNQEMEEHLRTIEKMGLDPSTGAINREGWEQYLQQHYGISHANIEHVEPHREAHKPTRVVVGVVDVCDLKVVNDKFGHEKGDAMLRMAVEAMEEILRKGDPIVRFGGDEFAFVLEVPANATDHEIEAFKQDIQRRFNERLAQKRAVSLDDLDANEQPEPIVAVGLSSGLMVDYNTHQAMVRSGNNNHVTTYHLLLKKADEAMYEHKAKLKAQGISLPRGGTAPGQPPESDPQLTKAQRERQDEYYELMHKLADYQRDMFELQAKYSIVPHTPNVTAAKERAARAKFAEAKNITGVKAGSLDENVL